MDKILIIFPTYNERENIRDITWAVLQDNSKPHVLIVDDNSPDGTGQIADDLSRENPRVHVIHRSKKEGLGKAYVAGFRYALENGYDYIFEMDADFSHNPKYIPAFLEKIREADLVIGSRYIDGVNVMNWPMSRLVLSYSANLYARLITGQPLCDATGGFKCFRRCVLEALDLGQISSEGYSFQMEVNFKAWKLGFRIAEIPIVFYDRRRGISKMSGKIMREGLWLLWKMRIVNLFKPFKSAGARQEAHNPKNTKNENTGKGEART